MNITEQIVTSGPIKKYLEESLKNNWTGTPWEPYPLLGTKQKGGAGELIVEEYMIQHGHTVNPPENAGHDRIIDGIKIEIKFSLAHSNTKNEVKLIEPDAFAINHISIGKSWEKLVFFGVNPLKDNPNIRSREDDDWPNERIYVMDKEGLSKHLQKENVFPFSRQQGGKKIQNDDWMLTGRKRFLAFTELSFVKEYKGGSL
jgi:hypothetical protein